MIDSEFPPAQHYGVRHEPRFLRGDNILAKLTRFITALRQYKFAQGPGGNGANEVITQCPLMIGCTSNEIADRAKSRQQTSGLNKTTSTWASSLCVFKSICLTPIAFAAPTLVIVAEQPMTTLARSLVTQDGFNIIEGGGQPDHNKVVGQAARKAYVYSTAEWFRKSLVRAETELERRERIHNILLQPSARNRMLRAVEEVASKARDALHDLSGWILLLNGDKEELQTRSEARLAEIARIANKLQHEQDGYDVDNLIDDFLEDQNLQPSFICSAGKIDWR